MKALFLGHDDMHEHVSRVNHYLLIPEFEQYGIQLDYSENLSDLNTENLANYDTLILYGNYAQITEQQEHDLIEFVENGKGLVGIHSASNCFLNSDKFTHILGGRYTGNGYEDFTATINAENENHPCLDNFEIFETKGETYTHTNLNDDLTILQFRKEGDHLEPWTWVRHQGKGRIFYTAYGHDRHTWENFDFHQLITNAVIWTSKKSNLTPIKQYPKFTYTYDSNGYLTNYEKTKTAPRSNSAPTSARRISKAQPPTTRL